MVDGFFVMKPYKAKIGYPMVVLINNGIRNYQYVHRLVAEAFLPNPNKLPLVNHKDENKENNNVENLEWCSPSYNTSYNGAAKKRATLRVSNMPIGYKATKNGEVYFFKTIKDLGQFIGKKKETAFYYLSKSPTHICKGFLLERIKPKRRTKNG